MAEDETSPFSLLSPFEEDDDDEFCRCVVVIEELKRFVSPRDCRYRISDSTRNFGFNDRCKQLAGVGELLFDHRFWLLAFLFQVESSALGACTCSS